MPGIDFRILRERITIQDVLALLGFKLVTRRGDQLRGPCPIHGSSSPRSRSFSVNLRLNTFRCFGCGRGGNQLDLWAAHSQLPLLEAARDLCAKLSLDVPNLHEQRSPMEPKTEKRNP